MMAVHKMAGSVQPRLSRTTLVLPMTLATVARAGRAVKLGSQPSAVAAALAQPRIGSRPALLLSPVVADQPRPSLSGRFQRRLPPALPTWVQPCGSRISAQSDPRTQ